MTILIGQDAINISQVDNGIPLIHASTSLPVSCNKIAHAAFLHRRRSLNTLLIIYIGKTATLFSDILENERHIVNKIRFETDLDDSYLYDVNKYSL